MQNDFKEMTIKVVDSSNVNKSITSETGIGDAILLQNISPCRQIQEEVNPIQVPAQQYFLANEDYNKSVSDLPKEIFLQEPKSSFVVENSISYPPITQTVLQEHCTAPEYCILHKDNKRMEVESNDNLNKEILMIAENSIPSYL